MIEPTSKDVNRRVLISAGGGPAVSGVIVGFTEYDVTVLVAGAERTLRRQDLAWAPEPHSGARALFEKEGFDVAVIDDKTWTVAAIGDASGRIVFRFWPDTGLWRDPDGDPGGSAVGLIQAMRGFLSRQAVNSES